MTKKIGLLGGMSWESTATYYRLINEGIKAELGGLHSAAIILYSVDFHDIEVLQRAGDWPATAAILAQAARSVEAAGAQMLLICTNTMHKVAPEIEKAVAIPLVHIADASAEAAESRGFYKVGLLGTRFTMEQDFYKGRLGRLHGIEVLIPDEPDRALVHRVIFEELCLGTIDAASRNEFVRIIQNLADRGAQAVMLGCTEIPLLVDSRHTSVPLLDTTELHVRKAVQLALES